ncbi:hypothetical protein BJV85_003568 [Clostridium acetobutylicum]|uniref:DUF3189 family protein n=1 Tax=Clostridium acetobutylicum (strain ATCC 824 / DSM 792 / JCM 1419 / IAM 19013 / LMG 5710 / NBRC 13948 / NRRL B-527 / VKM B-1787 / 2291 / W) TaxID=272562 RepID=Q97LV5_CLOAB|nr:MULTISPECIES: DUF3189 family protein [Clostridium]AAK78429.1 Hypothetical protein CA_C0449 [Clostridium acetobutylicum ATCC 824]ADZ19499.1 Conserved hypothetical protein [Clostridium acetobutylicum EA 2018]AEI31249.1 hypothetical protein SMB_G0458 [Clostridium acetobutylicum DSM 1731]AWV80151.1 DUF3189 family protein [Clostridium acetobutylicum]MBC2392332.1 DUF3189 family protein [Clostridium acetobutylicum]
MLVIYHDVGGAHSTAVAANIHINKLPIDRVPKKEELLKLKTFDKVDKGNMGHLIYIGEDEYKSKIYTIGRQYSANLVIPAIEDMYTILKKNNEELMIIDTKPTVNILMKIGGFTSRRLHLVSIGRPIVTYGSLKAYMEIAGIVRGVKNNLKEMISN